MNMTKPGGLRAATRPLAGRVALVTGSTSGIGLGIARVLAAEGADVVMNGLSSAADAEATRAGIAAETGALVAYQRADMGQPADIEAMVRTVEASLGRLDILVNNVGIQHVAPVESFPPQKWDAILAINLTSNFHAIRGAMPGMKARGFGRIVNIASAHGLVASPYKAAYVAAKHGVLGLTKVVAIEGAAAGITCNAICPGYVWTPLVEKQIDDQAKAHMLPREKVISDVLLAPQPLKRFATPEEIGALTAFLAGDAAASITGAALPVDGAWTAR